MSSFLLAFAVAALPVSAAAQDDAPQFGYVDFQQAISEVSDGQDAMERLSGELGERQESLSASEAELRELTAELEQELVLMDEETRQERLTDYQSRVQAYQEQYMANQQELMALEQEATSEIVGRMLEIVAAIAEERGLLMVFERQRSSLVWAAEGLDLTAELVRRYEE